MKAIEALQNLGLTPIEAAAYSYLVANPSATGYRVARGIGKATANVYRALEGLERKGAVLRDRSAVPQFRAVAPDDLMTALEHEFAVRRQTAVRALAELHAEESDERHYALSSPEQVMNRARILLAAARRIVLLDAPADDVETLTGEIADARSRGVRVVAIVRGTTKDAHADTFLDERPRRGGRAPLRMVADAREAVLAAVSMDRARVRDAVWTRSPLFAGTLHDALTSELFLLSVGKGVEEGLSVDDVESAFERCRDLRAGSGN